MDNTLVSLIIAAYNADKYLKRCLDSVISQTYTNLEIILVDDGSTDATGKICDAFAVRDERIRVIHQQNAGVSAARNSALDIATGEYLGFTDADDKLDPDYVETLVQNIQGYDMVLCGYHYVDTADQLVDISLPHNCVLMAQEFLNAYLGEEINVFGLEIRLAIGGYLWNKLFRLNIWGDIRFTLHLSMEDSLAVTSYVSRIKRINCVTVCKYFYYQILGSLTNTPGLHAHAADVIAIRKAQEQLVQDFVSRKQTRAKLLLEQAGLLVLLAYFSVLRNYLGAEATNLPAYHQYVRGFKAAFDDRFSCLRLCKTRSMIVKLLLYYLAPGVYSKIWELKYNFHRNKL